MTSVLVFGYCLVISLVVALGSVSAQPTRAFFVFGDSLVDSGNNDFLVTTARADAPPYGIDYPTHRPTGRFSNGLNIPDLINRRGKKAIGLRKWESRVSDQVYDLIGGSNMSSVSQSGLA
ncbi:hypothetical protein JHK85_008740 [Glycine max]|nr:hypothetical protein JHK85_008740 [Glycine max]